jgi:hypothetical protein
MNSQIPSKGPLWREDHDPNRVSSIIRKAWAQSEDKEFGVHTTANDFIHGIRFMAKLKFLTDGVGIWGWLTR